MKPLLIPERRIIVPDRPRLRRPLPDARFPHIWVPRRIIPARMAVGFDAQGHIDNAAGIAASFSSNTIITPAASATAMVVALGFNGTLPTGISVTWNAVSMTAITGASGATGTLASALLFGLVNPATGSGHTLAGSWTGNRGYIVVVETFTGTDTTGGTTTFPHGTTNNSASSTPATITITTANGNATFAGFFTDGGTSFAGTGSPTPDGSDNPGGPNGAWSHVLSSGASNTQNANLAAADDWVSVGTDILVSGSAPIWWESGGAQQPQRQHFRGAGGTPR